MNRLQDQQRAWLRKQLEAGKRGIKSALANALGVRPDAVSRMINVDTEGEHRDITLGELHTMAHFFKAEPPGLKTNNLVGEASENILSVMGRIGAGAEIRPDVEQVPPDGLFQIEIPFPVPEGTLAFQVEGDSMWPRYDPGDVVLCWGQGTNANEIIGWEAAVQTIDGRRYLKRIVQGSRTKHFDLESFNAPKIHNVKLEWVSKVQFVVRAGEWKQLGRTVQRRINKKMAATAK